MGRTGRIDSRPIYDGRIVHLSVDTVRFPDGSTGELEMVRHSGAAAVLPLLDPPRTGESSASPVAPATPRKTANPAAPQKGTTAATPTAPTADDPRILLLRQYRYAAAGELLEVPAGRPDRPGEPWDECARRELEEEAGLVAGSLVPLTTIFTTPGFTDERIHLFVALELRPGTHDHDQDEFIETVEMRLSEAMDRVERGEIVDAKTICTLAAAARWIR